MANSPEQFDLILIGSGAGLAVSAFAAQQGKKVAVVDDGPIGGTCLNRGCIPSKLLIHHADVIETIKRAGEFHIDATLNGINYDAIIDEVSKIVDGDSEKLRAGNDASKQIDLIQQRASFVDSKTVTAGGRLLTAPHIIISAGCRPSKPPIEGLANTPFLTSTEALRLKPQPKHLAVLGGGYIAAELAYFFGALGTKITIFQRGPVMVSNEDETIAKTFTDVFSRNHTVLVNHEVKRVKHDGALFHITAETKDGKEVTTTADQLLVALGVTPNTDTLAVEKAGIKADERGYIIVDEYLQTGVPGVWAFGDIIGRNLFRHAANWEAQYLIQNIFGSQKVAVDYTAMPHAIFSSPQVAGVGATEQELKKSGAVYQMGIYPYATTAMGMALKEKDGYVKILTDKAGKKILGCHIIGPDASTLIHEVVVAMKAAHGDINALKASIHIHPALNEVIQRAARKIQPR